MLLSAVVRNKDRGQLAVGPSAHRRIVLSHHSAAPPSAAFSLPAKQGTKNPGAGSLFLTAAC